MALDRDHPFQSNERYLEEGLEEHRHLSSYRENDTRDSFWIGKSTMSWLTYRTRALTAISKEEKMNIPKFSTKCWISGQWSACYKSFCSIKEIDLTNTHAIVETGRSKGKMRRQVKGLIKHARKWLLKFK